jgi:3,4-dihydroxy 2-butanone 4-phosphate synthase/GTP cyclohydrolase II
MSTNQVLGSLRCDCGEQLATAMFTIAEQGRGVVVFLRQEGRGIGLKQKLRCVDIAQ